MALGAEPWGIDRMTTNTMTKHDRICVVGAGPAGLATAYRLHREGFTNVTVLEKLPQIGGLCLTYEFQGRAFDLGANYVTSSYRRIRKMAKEVRAEMYIEANASFYDTTTGKYQSILRTARRNTSLPRFGYDSVRYLWKRWRLGRELPSSGFAVTDEHPDLLQSFGQWLDQQGLTSLRALFEIPITLMGYGPLDVIPAPYALTYMRVGSVLDLMIYGSMPFHRWPRRFVDGFQRFWARVAEPLDVRTGVHITSVQRGADGVSVVAQFPTEVDGNVVLEQRTLEFDWLVLCCPLQLSTTGEFLDLSAQEIELFERITLNPFCVTTYAMAPSHAFELKTRLVNVTPAPERSSARPTIITQQFKDNPLVTFYTPVTDPGAGIEPAVLAGVRQLAAEVSIHLPDHYETWNNFPYFPQVQVSDFANGWYRRVEAMQGTNRTFYNGGIMAFELIEPIVEYSECLVRTHFVARAT